MQNLILRRHITVPAYPNCFRVILTMDDGYELLVGQIAEQGATGMSLFWAWGCFEARGQEDGLEDAMTSLRASWSASDEDLAARRHEQEWTANKYALYDAGFRDQIRRGTVHCPCGNRFSPRTHEQTMAHIDHITGRNPGT